MHKIINGNCLDVMKTFPDNHFNCVVTDPPYGLQFMSKAWDQKVPGIEYWQELLRICKPGTMALVFGGTRTYHRLTCALEDAGWEIRDCIMWIYGSGFPKSLDISKAIDKHKGLERKYIGEGQYASRKPNEYDASEDLFPFCNRVGHPITEPASDLAKTFSGFGSALKPAYEPIILCMKPLEGTFVNNAEEWGVAGINIDHCRIGTMEYSQEEWSKKGLSRFTGNSFGKHKPSDTSLPTGRWPSNLILDEESADKLDEMTGILKSGHLTQKLHHKKNKIYGKFQRAVCNEFEASKGGASRFFYCAKASPRERNSGLQDFPYLECKTGCGGGDMSVDDMGQVRDRFKTITKNSHPTVKPLSLMKYLITLLASDDFLSNPVGFPMFFLKTIFHIGFFF